MSMSASCGTALISELEHFWLFLKSNDGQMLFLSLATLRAIFYYLLRHPMREARELAYVMLATGLFGLFVTVSETYPPKWMTRLVIACTETRSRVADSKVPLILFERNPFQLGSYMLAASSKALYLDSRPAFPAREAAFLSLALSVYI